jgi:hypothetical protein
MIHSNDFRKADYINNCCNLIECISKALLNNVSASFNYKDLICLFITILDNIKIDTITILKLIEQFITKISNTKKINEEKIKLKLYECQVNDVIINSSVIESFF